MMVLAPGANAGVEWYSGKIGCTLNLAELPDGSDRVLLVVYTFCAAGPVSELRSLPSPIGRTFTTAELAREAQPSVWRIEARNP